MHRRAILGFEIVEKAREPEKKAVNPELAKRLADLKNSKNKSNGGGENKSKFAKWEEKAKIAKQKEAQEAKGYRNGRTRWSMGWRWRKPAATS